MRQTLAKWGTTFIIWFFPISAITGVMLFFKVGEQIVKTPHEWIGLVVVAAFLVHLIRNWRTFLNYFKKPPIYAALAVAVIVAGTVGYSSLTGERGGEGGPGGVDMRAMIGIAQATVDAPVATIATIAGVEPAALVETLNASGIAVTDQTQSFSAVVTAAGKEPATVLSGLLPQSAMPQPPA